MDSEFFSQILDNIEETILIYDDKENLVYKNHDVLDNQEIIKRKNINIMGKNYIMISLGEIEKDELTGVLTKGAFYSRVNYLEDINSCVMVFCDIDNLKYYNERYGHIETDKIIKGVAHIITTNVRSTDIVARFGGDEFVILLRGTNVSKSYDRIESIRKLICSTAYDLKKVDGTKERVYTSMTFGISSVTKDVLDSMISADNMLVDGKKNEKNKVYVKK